jgi:HD-GYP domain-containing protein (c-di-GMP phosphodiesterase class II)
MLFDSDVPMLRIAADIAGSHHEFWDGSGYPEGIAGHDIPIAARIVSIVDVYDALVHSRVYKSAYQEHVALEMMAKLVGHQFDPDLFKIFLDNLEEMRQIRNRVPDTHD